MKIYAGVTDQGWFDFLRAQPGIDEVNFWQPSGRSRSSSFHQGDLFLFKLHRNERTKARLDGPDLIGGGGVIASFSVLPISWAWETFAIKNGAPSYAEMRRQLVHRRLRRRIPDDPHADFHIGCIILTQPFFLEDADWFPVPDWSASIETYKSYDSETQAGRHLWDSVQRAWQQTPAFDLMQQAYRVEEERARYGRETTIQPRLGQSAFRVLVADAYKRSCAITEEHTLPALEAAHIKPYGDSGPHAVYNGLLLRSDIHRLFDKGYITVTPELRIEVSRRIRDEFENGRYYYPFDGHKLHHLPVDPADHPWRELLIWHNEKIFKG
jgi:putative restriction endonuclease